MLLSSLTPPQLFRLYESGQIERTQLHEAMASHARRLIGEMEEEYRNPIAATLERVRNRLAAARLVRRHGEPLLREVLSALAEVPDFPPALLLWNARHPDVPLHCFQRVSHPPVFRLLKLETVVSDAWVTVEYGERGDNRNRERIALRRDRRGLFVWHSRRPLL